MILITVTKEKKESNRQNVTVYWNVDMSCWSCRVRSPVISGGWFHVGYCYNLAFK